MFQLQRDVFTQVESKKGLRRFLAENVPMVCNVPTQKTLPGQGALLLEPGPHYLPMARFDVQGNRQLYFGYNLRPA